jgi:thermitase
MRIFLAVALLSLTFSAHAYEAMPNEYLVRFKDIPRGRAFMADPAIRSHGEYRILKAAVAPMAHLRITNVAGARQILKDLVGNPNVAYVEPNYIFRIPAGMSPSDKILNRRAAAPTDPRFGELWGMANKGDNGGVAGIDINALKAWTVTRGSKKVIVAVIDTGIDYTHPDLAVNMWKNPKEIPGNGKDDDGNGFVDDVYGYDFANKDADPMDDHRHGTHCAGTIGAVHDTVGVAGVMHEVQLMAVKFLSGGGSGTLEAAVESIGYATRMGAHVMSNSWGGGPFTQALFESIKAATDRGTVFVAAAGNYASDNDKTPFYPSNYGTQIAGVIAVAAIDRAGKPASFTNRGKTSVHVAAPGVNILSSVLKGNYEFLSGTSMATPHVSGIVGLVLSREGSRAAPLMRERMMKTSRVHRDVEGISASGGFVDAHAAIMGKRQ